MIVWRTAQKFIAALFIIDTENYRRELQPDGPSIHNQRAA